MPGLARRDHERVGGTDFVQATVVERCRPIEDEAEHQLSAVAAKAQGIAVAGSQGANLCETTGGDRHFCFRECAFYPLCQKDEKARVFPKSVMV